jgi:hypothetical protein
MSLFSYRPLSVLVRDAETKKPIAGAEVSIWYPVSSGSFPPRRAAATTDADGIARLQAAPYGDAGIMLAGAAANYLSEENDISVEAIRNIEPDHWYKRSDKRPVGFVIEMYAEPRPTVELVLPPGYRGLVKARVGVRDDAPCSPGQRAFTCVVPASGIVEVQAPPLLKHFYPPVFRARYADGPLFDSKPAATEIGLRFLRSEGNEELFIVGTESDVFRLRQSTRLQGAVSEPSSSGSGGMRGGGRYRGSRQP